MIQYMVYRYIHKRDREYNIKDEKEKYTLRMPIISAEEERGVGQGCL